VLYAEKLGFNWVSGTQASNSLALPPAVTILDKFTQHEKRVYNQPFSATVPIPKDATYPLTFEVRFQGCDEANCYFPEEQQFRVSANGTIAPVTEESPTAQSGSQTPTNAAAGDWRRLADRFVVASRGSGYMGEGAFVAFLDQARSGKEAGAAAAGASFATGWSALLSVVLILLGGLALNLTPCVLPLIPINLAIIGAGSRAGSRARGFALGGAYAAGMAVAYGVLGLAVVLTGSKFGTLNSSPWFNLTIAAVFIVLALGMFDKINIDISRVTGGRGTRGPGASGSFLLAYSMGTVAALLAGACVAPVVISVLLQATQLYASGTVLGLALPFVLGIGMALPWPFMGAGLSFLPKPGGWMTRVKYGFGVMIGAFAGYYLMLAVGGFRTELSGAAPTVARAPSEAGGAAAPPEMESQLASALASALQERKPLFIDFWASWCKNCSAMEHTTFQAAAVQSRLAGFAQLRLQAEKPNQAPARPILDYFGALGLPTYVVLVPRPESPNTNAPARVAAQPPDGPSPDRRL
jgi:thiol:disulfide interchange protein